MERGGGVDGGAAERCGKKMRDGKGQVRIKRD